MYINIYIYAYTYGHIYIYHTYICLGRNPHTGLIFNAYTCTDTDTHILRCTCICIHMYVCIYSHFLSLILCYIIFNIVALLSWHILKYKNYYLNQMVSKDITTKNRFSFKKLMKFIFLRLAVKTTE